MDCDGVVPVWQNRFEGCCRVKANLAMRLRIGEGTLSSEAEAFKPVEYDFTPTHEVSQRGACPDCGGTVEHADGCVVCRGCGYTECG